MVCFAWLVVAFGLGALVRAVFGRGGPATPAENAAAMRIGRAIHDALAPFGNVAGPGPIEFGPPPPVSMLEPGGEHTRSVDE